MGRPNANLEQLYYMTLASIFSGTVRVVNAMSPEARSAILPIRDVDAFRESVAQSQQQAFQPESNVEQVNRVRPEGKSQGRERKKAPDIQVDAHTFTPPEIGMS